jgi:hypothetical protein
LNLLKANPKKISWKSLSENPSIFEIDTKHKKKKANDNLQKQYGYSF